MENASRFPHPHTPGDHAPPLCQNLCLLQRVKDLAVQELITQLSVEALTVPVLPRTPRLGVQRPRTQLSQPLPQLLGNELRPIVRTYVLGIPRTNITSANTSITCKLPKPAPSAAPNTPAYTRRSPPGPPVPIHRASSLLQNRSSTSDSPAPDATAHTNHLPATAALAPLYLRYFQPFASPDPLHSILTHLPSRALQQPYRPYSPARARIACVS